ncbi:MAG: hypothetical protein LLF89_03020, partial [Spirochaetaceae bacterium]|nr:hypothetical protein [Spirochaetaceae bacterium]
RSLTHILPEPVHVTGCEMDVPANRQAPIAARLQLSQGIAADFDFRQQGKQKIAVNGKEYLLELPLKGDIALIKAKKADKSGNLVFAKSARNFNPLMAMACGLVIAEVEEIVEIGELDPDYIHTPSLFIDYLVLA